MYMDNVMEIISSKFMQILVESFSQTLYTNVIEHAIWPLFFQLQITFNTYATKLLGQILQRYVNGL